MLPADTGSGDRSARRQAWALAAATLFLLTAAFVAYYYLAARRAGGWPGLLPFTPGWRDAGWLLAGCAAVTATLALFLKLVPLKHYYHPAVKLLADSFSLRTLAALYAANALAEELLFRGALQGWLGLLPAALLFTLAHVSYYKQPLMMLYVLCLGLLLGLLYAAGGSLWVCALTHA